MSNRPKVAAGVAVSSNGGSSPAPAVSTPAPAVMPQARMPRGGKRTQSGSIVVPGKQGFQTIYNQQLHDGIVDAVRSGMPVTFAAHLCRVNQPTVSNWLASGEEDPAGTFGEFAADVRQAQAEFVKEAIDAIKDSGMSDTKQWTALMTLLERIYPETFRRPGNDTNVNVGVGIQVGLVEKQLHELHDAGEIVYTGQ